MKNFPKGPKESNHEPNRGLTCWLLRVTLTFLVVLVVLGCQKPIPKPQSTLRIGFFPAQDYLPYFVIQEQSLDKQYGFELVEKAPFAGGAAVIEAMAAGLVDVGIPGSVPLISAASQGLIPGKVVAVAANNFADPDHPAVAVLVSSSVNNWKDLGGKHIAVNAVDSIQGVAIKGRLKQEGVQNYKLVEIPFPNMGLAVAGGNVAAATMYEPYFSQSLLRGDGKLLDWIIGGAPFERMEVTLIVFSADLYQNKPQALKAYLRAHLQAARWINQNPSEARSILTKRLQLSREIGQKIKLLRWPLDARSDPASLEQIQSVMMNVGMLKAKIRVNQLYDETLLNEVLAEKR